jgi:capsular exopolysaccharide synthesis family protein
MVGTMSEFFKALEQAERDRALARQRSAPESPADEPAGEAVSPSAPADAEPEPAEAATAAESEPVTAPPPVAPRAPVASRAPVAPRAPAALPPVTVPPPVAPRAPAAPAPAAPPAPRAVPATPPPPSEALFRPPAEPRLPRRQRAAREEERADGVDAHLVSLVTPSAFEAEQYRALRSMVEQFRLRSDLRMIAVSSASVGDGKTTTAINLAGALAQAATSNVLLIDMDLRRPSVVQQLAMADLPSPGLVGAIVDPRLTLADVVRRRTPFNLAVLPAGRPPMAPYEILKSPRLAELLEEARQSYDYVVVDTPPLVSVPDCRVIAQWVDGFLIIVAAHRTPKRLVEEALNMLDPGKIIGLVFNRDDRPLGGYSYGYGYGYGHGQPPSANGRSDGRLHRTIERARGLLPARRGLRS